MVISRPAVASNVVYLGSWDGKLYALNASNGSYIWSFATGGEIDSSPTISGGLVYVGSHDGKVYALNASTGMVGYNLELHNNVVWSFTTGDMVMFSSPAVADDGTIYFGCDDQNLYALNPDGSLKWSFFAGGKIESSITLGTNNIIYFASRNN